MLNITTASRSVFIALLLSISVIGKSQSISIFSWNIQDLGQTKDDSEILFIAKVLQDADIVAIQEVVAKHPGGAQAVARLADQLNRMGSKWDYRISHPTNSPSPYISERYAFLFRTSTVEIVGRPFLDSVLNVQCDREPYVARFRIKSNKKEFILVNFHSRPHDKHPEEEVKHFSCYADRFNIPVIIAGDFNMSENHEVFNCLYRQEYISVVKNQKTTLKHSVVNGEYLNHVIDNIYIPRRIRLIRGQSIDFVKNCESLEQARMISDHLPVMCEISL